MRTASPNKCLIVVPMKDPVFSKTRLIPALNARQRQDLALLLYKRTLVALLRVAALRNDSEVAVVTDSFLSAAIARDMHIQTIPENAAGSLSKAIDTAADWAAEAGFSSFCVIPADLAAPDEAEISYFISVGMEKSQPVICPATDYGTNAIFVSPPNLIKFQYGKQSALKHKQALEVAGEIPILLPLQSLRFDIDTQDCLQHACHQDETLKMALKVLS